MRTITILSFVAITALGNATFPHSPRLILFNQLRTIFNTLSSLAFVSTVIDSEKFFQRITELNSTVYEPGLTESDIYYPSEFYGDWKTNSTLLKIFAPLGVNAFGGNRTYYSALNDLNKSLVYTTKFIKADNSNKIVSDRLENVNSIAKVSMGLNSLIDQKQPDVNLARRLHLVISPSAVEGITVTQNYLSKF